MTTTNNDPMKHEDEGDIVGDESRWHGEAHDIAVTSEPDPDYKGPTT